MDLAAQDHGVGMFRLLAENFLDFIECLFVVFLIHQDLGTGVMDAQAEVWLAKAHQLVELNEGRGKILGDAVHFDRAEGGFELHFGTIIFSGIGNLAEPSAGGRQRTFAECESGVGDLEARLLLGAEGADSLARPDRQFLDQILCLSAALGLGIALKKPERVFQR